MHSTDKFPANVQTALHDEDLQLALQAIGHGFINKRKQAADDLPEFSQLRDDARDIKNHTLSHLDIYLTQFSDAVRANNGHIHWAETPDVACQTISDICRLHNAKTITKGKSMVSEEIGLNTYLQNRGYEIIETDLGEYIIQLRGEAPSHIIAPALHVRQAQIEETFRTHHPTLDADRDLNSAPALVREARTMLRERYLQADVGITGANFLIAETGSTVIVTNEGNGDMTQIFPRVHIVVTTIEKVIPTLDDLATVNVPVKGTTFTNTREHRHT
ncbi:MAG: LUD domain-containing protein [Pseudomonadota bacterium]